MNPDVKKVLGKFEFESHKVELALVNDLQELISNNVSANVIGNVKEQLQKVIKIGNDSIFKIESQNKEINKLISLFENQAKELGLKSNESPVYKNAVNKINNNLESIKILQSQINNIKSFGF